MTGGRQYTTPEGALAESDKSLLLDGCAMSVLVLTSLMHFYNILLYIWKKCRSTSLAGYLQTLTRSDLCGTDLLEAENKLYNCHERYQDRPTPVQSRPRI